MAEGMNLTVLRQRDPYIVQIVDTASQVALYSFNSKDNEWEKTDIGGTLFVYSRSASPVYAFTILNRNGPENQTEPIANNLEFQLQDPFLLYKTSKAIYGIWFYDKDECARIGQLMNSLVQIMNRPQEAVEVPSGGRQRRASDSESMQATPVRTSQTNIDGNNPSSGVDIMQMLSRAQSEYVKGQKENSNSFAAVNNVPVSIESTTPPVTKPKPVKAASNDIASGTHLIPTAADGNSKSITLESLFQNASKEQNATEEIEENVRKTAKLLLQDTKSDQPSINSKESTQQNLLLRRSLNMENSNSTTPPSGVAQKFITPAQLQQSSLPSTVLPPHPVNLLTPLHTGMSPNNVSPMLSNSLFLLC
ncbi:DgyrCDS4400 [Dimorphilus gyrociliatus]|uniref:5'-(N(7)-methylguanosine 5'-triphospho)-[mRNA] hydrolase n=1 Tax=Dimorphilus gyrociliatus TaxID=2664684 RepID=A0A7I8VJJ1_9ANNE|nr:DgyrCDS4400 [Dimorphilus gyrociliatus]